MGVVSVPRIRKKAIALLAKEQSSGFMVIKPVFGQLADPFVV
jgi:hypothetical protein